MRGEMARGKISTAPFASILAHPGTPIFAGGEILKRFAPVRALFACGRPKPVRMAIECKAEELLQCMRVEFPAATRSRTPHALPACRRGKLSTSAVHHLANLKFCPIKRGHLT